MKKNILLPAVIFLLFGHASLFAQPEEPEDPAVIFPSIVLEIEDLSIETIDAGLPREEKLLTFEREIPLPGPGEIPIVEPAVEPLLPVSDVAFSPQDNKSFFTQVLLGAGLQNNLLSEITFYRLGLQPIVKLLFSHENADGFAYNQIGLGYGIQNNMLEGAIKYQTDDVTIRSQAGFQAIERGLQEQVSYFSVMNQFSNVNLFFAYKASERFTLSSTALAEITGFHLTGASPPGYTVSYPPTEYLLSGGVKGELRWETVRTHLGIDYTYRNIPGDAAFEIHRLHAAVGLGLELSDRLNAEAKAGFFTSTQIPYLFPFEISLRGFPFDWLSVSLGGGYAVREYNLAYILHAFDFVDMPGVIQDNHGWFGNLNTQISFENSLLLILDFTLAENAHYLSQSDNHDTATGLFPAVFTDDVIALSMDFRLRFPIFTWLSINSINNIVIPFSSMLISSGKFGLEASAEQVDGAFGIKVSVAVKTDFYDSLDFPVLDAGAFVRLLDNMKLIVEALDLLSPLLDQPRSSQYPYLSPGIRARFKFQISF